MSSTSAKFPEAIHVTRPIFPDLSQVYCKLAEIWGSQWLTNHGEQHRLLEKRLTEQLSVPYLSLFNNGTIALMTAVRCLDLRNEVITTPLTFPATPHALTWNGITPVFCDIEPNSLNLNPDKIEALITSKTTGILGTHLFGTPCDVARIKTIADRNGLKVVYDAAHAFQTEIGGQGIGNFGDISMFSFHATKLFHTIEGGGLTCKSPAIKEKIDRMRNFGFHGEGEVLLAGINGKLNEIQAGIGILVLDQLEIERQKRRALVKIYHDCLQDIEGIRLLSPPTEDNQDSPFMIIMIDALRFGFSRDQVHQTFRQHNVFTRRYFYPLCSDFPHYQHLASAKQGTLPVARKAATELLALPLYGELTASQVETICAILISMPESN